MKMKIKNKKMIFKLNFPLHFKTHNFPFKA